MFLFSRQNLEQKQRGSKLFFNVLDVTKLEVTVNDNPLQLVVSVFY